MTLIYRDLEDLFPKKKGITDPSLRFLTVTTFANIKQPKGIFIPLFPESGDLKEAIENGAIATLWNIDTPLPSYTPNHFIVFYCTDLWRGLKNMLNIYEKSLAKMNEMKAEEMGYTNFLIFDENSLNNRNHSYDIAVIQKKLKTYMARNSDGEGSK